MTGEMYPTTRDVVIGTVGFAATVGIIAIISFGAYRLAQKEQERTARQNAFVTECIEYYPERRCKEFWGYGRTDLGRKP